jgi:hypothetical protein
VPVTRTRRSPPRLTAAHYQYKFTEPGCRARSQDACSAARRCRCGSRGTAAGGHGARPHRDLAVSMRPAGGGALRPRVSDRLLQPVAGASWARTGGRPTEAAAGRGVPVTPGRCAAAAAAAAAAADSGGVERAAGVSLQRHARFPRGGHARWTGERLPGADRLCGGRGRGRGEQCCERCAGLRSARSAGAAPDSGERRLRPGSRGTRERRAARRRRRVLLLKCDVNARLMGLQRASPTRPYSRCACSTAASSA